MTTQKSRGEREEREEGTDRAKVLGGGDTNIIVGRRGNRPHKNYVWGGGKMDLVKCIWGIENGPHKKLYEGRGNIPHKKILRGWGTNRAKSSLGGEKTDRARTV